MANQRLHTTLHPHPHHIPSRATIADHCGRHHPQTYWPCPTLTTPHSYTKCSPTTNKKKWRFNYHINSRHSRSRQFLCQLLRSCENSTSNHNFIYLFLCFFFYWFIVTTMQWFLTRILSMILLFIYFLDCCCCRYCGEARILCDSEN